MNIPIPENEESRLDALRQCQILDTPPEQDYDDIALIAAEICNVPIALISLVDEDRQWFKAKVGLEAAETSRDLAFCAHVILPAEPQTMIVSDAFDDARFASNPLVTGNPNIRFYAGAPLVTPDNQALGTLCVIDREPRVLTPPQQAALEALARQVSAKLELRRVSILLSQANDRLREMSLTDELTGLNNRRGFLFQAEQQLKLIRSGRIGNDSALVFADMDGLKQINDRYGHATGSEAIAKTGEIIKQTFRDSDIAARLGGDEFSVLAIDASSETCEKLTSRLQQNLEAYNARSELPYQLALSIGTVMIESGSRISLDELIAEADQKMYEQKRLRKADQGSVQ